MRALAWPKRTIMSVVLCAALMGVGVVGVVIADAASAVTTAMTTTGSVNLRSGPGTTYGVLVAMPAGAKVTATDVTSGAWVQVSYGGRTGYVYGSYLRATATTTPVTSAPATTAGSAWTTARVNLRTGPGTNYAVLTVLPTGTVLPATGVRSGSWTQVVYAGTARWLYSSFVAVTAAPKPAPAPPSVPPPPAPVVPAPATPKPTTIAPKVTTPRPTPSPNAGSTPSTPAPTTATPSAAPSLPTPTRRPVRRHPGAHPHCHDARTDHSGPDNLCGRPGAHDGRGLQARPGPLRGDDHGHAARLRSGGRDRTDHGHLSADPVPRRRVLDLDRVHGEGDHVSADQLAVARCEGGDQSWTLPSRSSACPTCWGAEGPASYDCSGLTMAAYFKIGVCLPHHAADQINLGTPSPART